jgi:hypothetical protein
MKRFRIIIAILVLGAVLFTKPPITQAATTVQKRGGITVSPAFQDVTITGNNTEKLIVFTITNNDSYSATYSLKAVDMGTLDNTGGLVFAGLAESYASKYGVAKWVTLDSETVTVAPKGSESVRAVINNDETFTLGGHYGAIIIRTAANSGEGQNNVSVSPQAATLLFIKKLGGEKYSFGLQKTQIPHSVFHLPTSVTLTFKNTGNIHIIPRGIVTITDPFGKVVKKGIINENSSLILPERTRSLDVNMNSYGVKALLPGIYKVHVAYRDDSSQTIRAQTYSFFWLNLPLLLLHFILSCLILLAGYKAWKFIIHKRNKKSAKKTPKAPIKIEVKTE